MGRTKKKKFVFWLRRAKEKKKKQREHAHDAYVRRKIQAEQKNRACDKPHL